MWNTRTKQLNKQYKLTHTHTNIHMHIDSKRDRERARERAPEYSSVCVCVWVRVWERERAGTTRICKINSIINAYQNPWIVLSKAARDWNPSKSPTFWPSSTWTTRWPRGAREKYACWRRLSLRMCVSVCELLFVSPALFPLFFPSFWVIVKYVRPAGSWAGWRNVLRSPSAADDSDAEQDGKHNHTIFFWDVDRAFHFLLYELFFPLVFGRNSWQRLQNAISAVVLVAVVVVVRSSNNSKSIVLL